MKELWKVYTRNFVDDEGIVKAIRYTFFFNDYLLDCDKTIIISSRKPACCV